MRMTLFFASLFLTASLMASGCSASGSSAGYAVDGPDVVTTSTLAVESGFSVDAYVPSSNGTHPVVVLSAGLQQPASAYAPYGQRLASWGIVTLIRSDPGFTVASSSVADDLVYLVHDWLPTQSTGSGALAGRIDLTRVGFAGHSRGGEASLLAVEGGAKGLVKALFGIDPVDEAGASGAAGSLSTIALPLAFIGETTDDGAMDCAPAAQNFQALYAAASSPAVALTAVGADHTMFEVPTECSFCTLCTAGTASQSVVADEAAHYLMAYFARELLGDATVGASFAGAGLGGDVKAGRITEVSK